jgi:hypothetical protein
VVPGERRVAVVFHDHGIGRDRQDADDGSILPRTLPLSADHCLDRTIGAQEDHLTIRLVAHDRRAVGEERARDDLREGVVAGSVTDTIERLTDLEGHLVGERHPTDHGVRARRAQLDGLGVGRRGAEKEEDGTEPEF